MKILIICALFVAVFGRQIGDKVFVRDLGPVHEQHPEELTLQLDSSNGNRRTLALTRRDGISPDVRTFKVLDGQITEEPMKELNTAAYIDVENGAAFLVESKRSEVGVYKRHVHGILADGDHELHLEPVAEESRKRDVDGAVQHLMVRRKIETRHIDNGPVHAMLDPSPIDKRAEPNTIAQTAETNVAIDKRSGEPLYTVELLFVVDYEAYKRFESDEKVKQYYALVAAGMDLRYANIKDADFKITVKLRGFVLLSSASDSAITLEHKYTYDTIYATKALAAFNAWRTERLTSLVPHDHGMIFTGYDLVNNTGGKSVAGLAYSSTICKKSSPVSIVEDLGKFKCVGTASHELGHGLGAGDHDGEGNECDGNDQYIMAAVGGAQLPESKKKNPYNWSPCTIRQFQALLQKLNNDGNNCLKNGATSIGPDASKPPGQIWGPDKQCADAFGTGAKYVAGKGIADKTICSLLRCWRPSAPKSSVWRGPALRGTTCGNKKWCFESDCVANDNAPAAPDECIFGDTPMQIYQGKTCSQIVVSDLWLCYQVADQCCKSCPANKVKNAPAGCEYGDKVDCSAVKANPGMCENSDTATKCCKTCADAKTTGGDPSCPYGDKTDCSIMKTQPWQCYANAALCCKTCGAFKTKIPGCLYGDKGSFCSQAKTNPAMCYNNDEACCKSCADVKDTSNPSCPYGDKTSSCSTLTPGSATCEANSALCCKTCKT